jgi:hypothetical protein
MQLTQDIILEKIFPKTFSWQARYRAAVEDAKTTVPEPTVLDGRAAAEHIHRSDVEDTNPLVDSNDPSGLQEGVEIEIYPADWGCEYRDFGRMVGLTPDEVTIAVQSEKNAEILVHAPRTGFRIKKIG